MKKTITDLLRDVLEGIDVGGEQSREFATEIRLLRKVISISSLPQTTDTAAIDRFLKHKGFIVLGKNKDDPSASGPFEAWAYKGHLDFNTSHAVVFGCGQNVTEAVFALETHLNGIKHNRKGKS
jgi:hypothetical protein